jgi:uncharacterized protein (TIGR00369 family)
MSSRFTDTPVNRLFGFELLDIDGRGASVAFRPRTEHAQEYGVVHGGILSALADTAAVYTILAAVYTVLPSLKSGERMTSIEFKLNFLAAATTGGGEVVATARLVRKGRTVAVVSADVHQGQVHVATGLFTYIMQRTSPG